jgi:hypothetical protein
MIFIAEFRFRHATTANFSHQRLSRIRSISARKPAGTCRRPGVSPRWACAVTACGRTGREDSWPPNSRPQVPSPLEISKLDGQKMRFHRLPGTGIHDNLADRAKKPAISRSGRSAARERRHSARLEVRFSSLVRRPTDAVRTSSH